MHRRFKRKVLDPPAPQNKTTLGWFFSLYLQDSKASATARTMLKRSIRPFIYARSSPAPQNKKPRHMTWFFIL